MNTNGGQAAVDRAKIVAVVNSIACAADRREWTALERAFGPEATLDNGATEKLTPAEIVARRRALISSLLSKLRVDWRVLAMKLAPGESSGNRGHLRRGQAARRHGCPGVWLGGCR
jgi:hypothetical protein